MIDAESAASYPWTSCTDAVISIDNTRANSVAYLPYTAELMIDGHTLSEPASSNAFCSYMKNPERHHEGDVSRISKGRVSQQV